MFNMELYLEFYIIMNWYKMQIKHVFIALIKYQLEYKMCFIY